MSADQSACCLCKAMWRQRAHSQWCIRVLGDSTAGGAEGMLRCTAREIAMAGWLHGVFVGDWLFVFPLCGFSLSLFCNYRQRLRVIMCEQGMLYDAGLAMPGLMC